MANNRINSSLPRKFILLLVLITIAVGFVFSFLTDLFLDFLGPAKGGITLGLVLLVLAIYLEKLQRRSRNNDNSNIQKNESLD